jgi:hypothetical protein
MCFVEGAIGVPAVAMINWDDDFIHSTDDDLDKLDQTQLRRNGFLIASMAYYLSFAESDDLALLAGETYSQGGKRLANDLKVAIESIKGSQNREEGWKDATMVVEQGVKREIRALNSMRVFAGSDPRANQIIEKMIARTSARGRELVADIEAYYEQMHGGKPPAQRLTEEELAANKKIPVNAATLQDYFTNRNSVTFNGNLHVLMRSEVYNFVDGERSYYDIYKAVRAEAMAAGSWYYGVVTLKDVVNLLDASVQAKALVLKSQ